MHHSWLFSRKGSIIPSAKFEISIFYHSFACQKFDCYSVTLPLPFYITSFFTFFLFFTSLISFHLTFYLFLLMQAHGICRHAWLFQRNEFHGQIRIIWTKDSSHILHRTSQFAEILEKLGAFATLRALVFRSKHLLFIWTNNNWGKQIFLDYCRTVTQFVNFSHKFVDKLVFLKKFKAGEMVE